jgi:hypothetical protein|tara:strand:- start:126 stop:326 length:201 start_codon:yes stop_codon:yes gene_type:complete
MSNKKYDKSDEIAKIKEAKKNGGVYVSPSIISPQRINEIFLQALNDVLNDDNNNINLNNKGGQDVK